MMAEAWRPPGYCVPNPRVYPHQWLWDSCFHAVIWARLDPARGVQELNGALSQQFDSGFVPHMVYWQDPTAARSLWGTPRTSVITQPPMYGHALVRLARTGETIPIGLVERAVAGLAHLLGRRTRTPAGLVPVFHPWETGCDDSLRWCSGRDPYWWRREGRDRWRTIKQELVAALYRADDGTPVGSERFVVGSVGFSSLVAWNVRELASVVADLGAVVDAGGSGPEAEQRWPEVEAATAALTSEARDLEAAVAARWDEASRIWIDDPVVGPSNDVGLGLDPSARTLDAMLGLLVDNRPDAGAQLVDPSCFGATYGPRGAHRDEPAYDPDTYWRGPAWPQLSYLIWQAVGRCGPNAESDTIRRALAAGAEVSGLAEFWNPETGAGGGARPQTWSGLGLLATGSQDG